MSGFKTHETVGGFVGGTVALVCAQGQPPILALAETFGGILAGRVAGVSADIFEPGISSHHRDTCHALAPTAYGATLILQQVESAQASLRTQAQACFHLAATTNDGFQQLLNVMVGFGLHMLPGQLRRRDVRVGLLVPVSPGALPRFLQRFEQVYGTLGKTESIISSAAAHHRLLWMHPFLDGNGRVARLMSHAMLLNILDTGGVWSVARGLARNAGEYKTLLANCDLTRRNDLDGRGTLSEEALAEFTRFFLTICIDQVTFMEGLFQPDSLRARILLWAEEKIRLGELPPKSGSIIEAVLYRGELPRGDADTVVGTGERQARRIVSALLEKGVLVSANPRAPLRLAFPATLASRWMPGLFPDKTG